MSRIGTDFAFDFVCQRRVLPQHLLGIFPALSELFAVIREPRAGFFDNAGLDAEVNQFADLGNPLAVPASGCR